MHETWIKVICTRKKTNTWRKKLKISRNWKLHSLTLFTILFYEKNLTCARKNLIFDGKNSKFQNFSKLKITFTDFVYYTIWWKKLDMRPEKPKISQKSIIHPFTWISVIADWENQRFGKKIKVWQKKLRIFRSSHFS